MTDLRARTAGPADFNGLLEIDPAGDGAARQRFLRRAINANDCYVADREGEIVAFGILSYTFFEHGLITAVVVSESVRYTETVIALLRYIEGRCRTQKLFASTAGGASALQSVLKKIGFEECGSITHIGEGEEPEVFFFKQLDLTDARVPEHHFGLG